MTGQTLAEVLQEVADARCLNHGPNYGGCVDCAGAAEESADAVTAHLAAVLADVETVEAVAEGLPGCVAICCDKERRDVARAAIAVIASRLGVQA